MAGPIIEVNLPDGAARAYVARPGQGGGPGLLLLGDNSVLDPPLRDAADLHAEEGYLVLAPEIEAVEEVAPAVAALKALPGFIGGVGGLGFGSGASLLWRAGTEAGLAVVVVYEPPDVDALLTAGTSDIPVTLHLAGRDNPVAAATRHIEIFTYPEAAAGFSAKGDRNYNKPAAAMAHTRSVAALRRVLGPHYDLAALWEQHCLFEFGERDVPKTMATMVAEPYVNHVPTMTGGVGQEALARFYRDHFVNSNPKDTRLIPVSRTIGTDRVVDEVLFCFTHDVEIPWMLPGVQPTGKYVEVPLVAIVAFRGDKLYHEHIYWDQASILAQIGLLDPATLPIAGAETARKLVDETLPSNELMRRVRRA
jgi:carboxymethylenebutenolidase